MVDVQFSTANRVPYRIGDELCRRFGCGKDLHPRRPLKLVALRYFAVFFIFIVEKDRCFDVVNDVFYLWFLS